jgi:hypothetical protein
MDPNAVEEVVEAVVETAAQVTKMAPGEVTGMISEAFKAMGIGVAGVFVVLAVFFVSLRLLMAKAGEGAE